VTGPLQPTALTAGGLDSTRVEAIAAATHGFPESLTEARRGKLWSADERAVLTAAADAEDPAVRELVTSLLPLLGGARVDALARGAHDAQRFRRSEGALATTAHTWAGHHALAEMVIYLRAADRHHAAATIDDYLTARQQVLHAESRRAHHITDVVGPAANPVPPPAPVSTASADPPDQPHTTPTDGHPAARAATALSRTTSTTSAHGRP
jgi:hypothetical protein